jgi:hypothetical protein
VESSYPWLPETKNRIGNWINLLTAFYAKCVTHGDATTAQKQLKIHQREQVSLLGDKTSNSPSPCLGCLGTRHCMATDDRPRTSRGDWRRSNEVDWRVALKGEETRAHRVSNSQWEDQDNEALGLLPTRIRPLPWSAGEPGPRSSRAIKLLRHSLLCYSAMGNGGAFAMFVTPCLN